MLKVELQTEILALYYDDKKSVRAIAQRLGINRKSVAAVVARRILSAQFKVKGAGTTSYFGATLPNGSQV